jgi:hypothetical protein
MKQGIGALLGLTFRVTATSLIWLEHLR